MFSITIELTYKKVNIWKTENFTFGGGFCVAEQVYKRLKLTLELVKKEMEISKIQVIMSLAFMYVLH